MGLNSCNLEQGFGESNGQAKHHSNGYRCLVWIKKDCSAVSCTTAMQETDVLDGRNIGYHFSFYINYV